MNKLKILGISVIVITLAVVLAISFNSKIKEVEAYPDTGQCNCYTGSPGGYGCRVTGMLCDGSCVDQGGTNISACSWYAVAP